ncbi:SDR family oxidoreductase [Persicitalea jodogahamensis]|uniref:Short-chain dehydrogenase/reductase n=1 Tax=Persicitalea jodogahamensis TaxID=402147 RepID=A0A8J3D4J1_9BACT|nr:SDR family oxidoreductase [Persicitalea jodogahamensis]GHB58732.1 short-chain dehydrogenase/reductase [Persicitalea jodogahamensis]
MSFTSQVILITGASSGIGRSTAEYLVKKGYRVFGASRSEPEKNVGFEWVCMDVTSEESVGQAVSQVLEIAGRIDVLINNAGLGIVGPLEETTDELIHTVFNTNVMGTLRVCRAIIPILRSQQSGMILNISSIAAEMGLPFRGIYSASKASLEILTESLSMELKEFNIRVCSLLPGDIATSINQNRLVVNLRENSVYADRFAKIHHQINEEVSQAAQPIVIAKAVARIIGKKNPELHYTVGPFIQKSAILLRRILPQRAFERLLMWFYGI